MDIDVEAMLDAPYEEKRPSSPRHSDREHRDREHGDRDHKSRGYDDRRERDRRDYRDYRDEDYRSSRHHYRSSRSRSRSRHRSSGYESSSRHRRRYSRDRGRHSSRDYRSSSRRRSRSPKQRSPVIAKSRSPSPPAEDRDRRTVFVTQLAARLTNRELDEFFSQAGKVRQAQIIMDRHSRKSKGVGYVEFYEEESVQNALALSGVKLLGIPVLVSLSEAEKNRLAMQASGMGTMSNDSLYQRLYIGSIHFSLTEDDVRQIFEPFGPLDFVNLHKDPETGRSKGYGFIQFKNGNDAKQALEKMNGFELAGRNIKVGLVTTQMASSGGGWGGGYNLDDGETEGVAFNSLSRAELMSKLARRGSMEEEASKPASLTGPPKPFIPVSASRYVMLNNMFDPAEETEPDWVSDLETDIKLESENYGHVEHIKVNADSMGEVFLKFDNSTSAEKAIKALNGRWFGGKKVTASYVSEAIYNANAL